MLKMIVKMNVKINNLLGIFLSSVWFMELCEKEERNWAWYSFLTGIQYWNYEVFLGAYSNCFLRSG